MAHRPNGRGKIALECNPENRNRTVVPVGVQRVELSTELRERLASALGGKMPRFTAKRVWMERRGDRLLLHLAEVGIERD